MTEPPYGAPTVPGLTGLTVLARGGYATVFRAAQVSVGRDVAVKIENRTLENERDQRRFLREARAAGRMSSHPHVVDLFDAGVTVEGHPYLIMELCEGSYAERIKTNPLSAAEARDIGVKIADALADAHALGVLHRDVKPANLLQTRFGEPALADFGLAILSESRDQSITLDVLTPAYAPPEVFRYAPPSPAGDVYALCATLYALMHGKPARWREDRAPSLVSLVDMFAEPIAALPGTPPELMELLRVGMANDDGARPTAAQLRDALAALRIDVGAHHPGVPSGPGDDDATVQRVKPSLPASMAPLALADLPDAEPPPPPHAPAQFPLVPSTPAPKPDGRRRRLLAVGAVSVVLAVVGGLTWYALGHPLPHVGPPVAHRSSLPAPSASSGQVSPSPSATSSGAGCLVAAFTTGVRCPSTPECYDGVVVTAGVASALAVACTQQHTWEVFVLFDLPSDLTGVDHETVKANASVRRMCNAATLTFVDFKLDTWQVEVLPPTPAAFSGGDRTARCLAGPGAGAKSTGSKFVH